LSLQILQVFLLFFPRPEHRNDERPECESGDNRRQNAEHEPEPEKKTREHFFENLKNTNVVCGQSTCQSRGSRVVPFSCA